MFLLVGFLVPTGLVMVSSACLARYCLLLLLVLLVLRRVWILNDDDNGFFVGLVDSKKIDYCVFDLVVEFLCSYHILKA